MFSVKVLSLTQSYDKHVNNNESFKRFSGSLYDPRKPGHLSLIKTSRVTPSVIKITLSRDSFNSDLLELPVKSKLKLHEGILPELRLPALFWTNFDVK